MTFSLLTLLLVLATFFGNVIFIDNPISTSPEIITNVVFHEVGKPRNGIRKIKMPRKNVDLCWIMPVLYRCYGFLAKEKLFCLLKIIFDKRIYCDTMLASSEPPTDS